ncbi:MAG: AAC(3) family N-acetyltransferase [Armatimonadetes bacterium]|nr:AAC(3) family N-acetyltransferase [Armatimonadota bacterium]
MAVHVTGRDIAEGLSALGLCRGDAVLTHSSLSSFGHVEGGANAVIDAILDIIGPEGTALFPTLTGSENLSPRNPPVFNPAEAACWTGIIPETARKRPEAVRSRHPTHSVAAIGRLARWITAGHEYCPSPCWYGSPYDKVREIDGYILLIGCAHASNTTFHHIEETAPVDYVCQKEPTTGLVVEPNGSRTEVTFYLHSYEGPSRDYPRMEPLFIESGIQATLQVGNATLRLIRSQPMCEMVLERVRRDPMCITEAE